MSSDDHIFTIWLTDGDWQGMPFLDEICIASAQVMNNAPVTIYTNHELHLSFLDRKITNVVKLDNSLLEKAKQYCGDNKAHQSDYIRLYLLMKNGGIYFDTDIIFWDSFENIWNIMEQQVKSVLYLREDKNMICNCCIFAKGGDNEFFKDMLWYYENRFIKHSYLFNSQKMMNLMRRRHNNLVAIYEEPSLFSVPWNDTQNKFLLGDKPSGIGQHLYSSIENWKPIREFLDNNCFNKDTNGCYPIELTKNIITSYIDMMKEEDDGE